MNFQGKIILVVGALGAALVVPTSQASSLHDTRSESIVSLKLSVSQATNTAIMSGFSGQSQELEGFKATSKVDKSLPVGLLFDSRDDSYEVPNNQNAYMQFNPSNEFYLSHKIEDRKLFDHVARWPLTISFTPSKLVAACPASYKLVLDSNSVAKLTNVTITSVDKSLMHYFSPEDVERCGVALSENIFDLVQIKVDSYMSMYQKWHAYYEKKALE